MATTTNKLQILIEAKNRASGELNKLQGEVGGLSGKFGGLVKGAGAVAVALGALRAGEAAFELGRASAESARLATAFDQLATAAGGSSRDMLSAMREASRGMIDDTSLIAAANKAMLLGVADTSGEMSKLLEIAGARARAMGLTTQQAFGDLVTGLGRMSPMILDNLGITIDAEGAYQRYAQSIGQAADALSDNEKKQALVNEVIRTSADLLEANAGASRDMAGSFERMDASLANAKDALGALFSPAAAAIAEQLANAVDNVTASMTQAAQIDAQNAIWNQGSQLSGLVAELERQTAAMQDAAIAGDGAGLRTAAMNIETLRVAVAAVGEEYNRTAAITGAPLLDLGQLQLGVIAYRDLAAEQAAAAQAAAENQSAMAAQAAQANATRSQILGLVEGLREIQSVSASASAALKSSFLGAAENIGGAAALNGFRQANQQLEAQIAIYQELGLSAEEIEFRVQGFIGGVRDANSELGRTVTAVAAVDSAFENLKSKVAGVLSGALNVNVGVNPDDFLPREDAINEDARRLADVVVNGFNSPWAAYLQDKFPELFGGAMDASGGNIQQAAAQLMKDFQAGLRPELMDKDAAKEQVKRLLMGDANMAELANEIAQELNSEMGGQFSLAQIQSAANSALGAGGQSADAGEAAGGGMVNGMLSKAGGLAEALDAKLKEQYKALAEVGSRAGAQWGAGFLDAVGGNIPAALVNILVELATPGVYARILAMQSQTGAVN